jgi:hypothetical protein
MEVLLDIDRASGLRLGEMKFAGPKLPLFCIHFHTCVTNRADSFDIVIRQSITFASVS